MSTATAKRTNGKATNAVCRHSTNCEVAETQRDLRAQLQQLGEAMGEAMGRIDDRLNSIALHVSDIGERQVRADQRESEWLSTLEAIERKVNHA